MNKLLFYCESSAFGGHEKMALAAHNAMRKTCSRLDIHWIVNSKNDRLIAALSRGGVAFSAIEGSSGFSLNRDYRKSARKVQHVRALINEFGPDLVTILQGGIKESTDGVLACLLSGQVFCSYLPMVHWSERTPDVKMPAIRNLFRWPFYRSIPNFITIDPEQARKLRRLHSSASIRVVENYVPLPQAQRRTPRPGLQTTIAVIGRIEFSQKRQDWFLDQVRHHSFFHDKQVTFIGEGPDSSSLAAQIERHQLSHRCQMLGWTDDLAQIYDGIDVVAIPSRIEGVPLVMLEALGRRIPVVGTDRDGMKTWLPAEWRFRADDGHQMCTALACALANEPAECWNPIGLRLAAIGDELRFGREFLSSMASFAPSGNTSLQRSVTQDGATGSEGVLDEVQAGLKWV